MQRVFRVGRTNLHEKYDYPNLKTAISGAYHSIKFAKYAHRYLAEFQYRFNRRFDMRAIFARLACVATRSSPHNRLLIRAAEVGC